MYDYLLDSIEIDNDQVYSLFDKADNTLTIVCVESAEELDYHTNFPLTLKVGDKALCGENNSIEVIRIR